LEAALGIRGEKWLEMQAAFDLSKAQKKSQPKIARLAA